MFCISSCIAGGKMVNMGLCCLSSGKWAKSESCARVLTTMRISSPGTVFD